MGEKPRGNGQQRGTRTLRASVSFPKGLYETLEQMAKEQKVSVAWIVRDAAERYVHDKWPLLVEKK